ncbi:MAG: hypothetical protein WDZ52_03565 [Pseudohongiellaceae bacterium]
MKLDRALLKKILFILIIIAVAPFALEVVLLADVAGAEFAVLFAIYYLKSTAYIVLERWLEFKRSVLVVCTLLAELYCFRPRVMASHLAASSLLLVLTSSALLCCLMWLPPLYLSTGFLS